MLRSLLIILAAFMLLSETRAQEDLELFSENVLLRNEHAFGVFLHSQGYGFEFRKGFNSDFFTKWLFEANLLEMKSERETRVANSVFRNSRSYIYGKLNNTYMLRAGGGRQKLLNRKPYWGGVELRYFWFGGASMAMVKPVYLNIIQDLTFNQFYVTYSLKTERYDPGKHNYENIYGRAQFFKGFDELKISPGVYGKFGFSFDFAKQNQVIMDLETGVTLEFYPKAISIMALRPPERFFLTFYISAHLGKRYH